MKATSHPFLPGTPSKLSKVWCLADFERNGHSDSDFYAIWFDPDLGFVGVSQFASTRYGCSHYSPFRDDGAYVTPYARMPSEKADFVLDCIRRQLAHTLIDYQVGADKLVHVADDVELLRKHKGAVRPFLAGEKGRVLEVKEHRDYHNRPDGLEFLVRFELGGVRWIHERSLKCLTPRTVRDITWALDKVAAMDLKECLDSFCTTWMSYYYC